MHTVYTGPSKYSRGLCHAKQVKRMRDIITLRLCNREGRNKHRHTANSRTMGGSCMLTRRHANRLIPYRYYPTYSCDHRPCPCTAVRMNGTWYGLVSSNRPLPQCCYWSLHVGRLTACFLVEIMFFSHNKLARTALVSLV